MNKDINSPSSPPRISIDLSSSEEKAQIFKADTFGEEPQKVLDARMSTIQVPVSKPINKVPDEILKKLFQDN